MDDDETIPRREVLAGLSLLGVLSLALVGTIAFRIIHAAPRRGVSPSATTWASQPAVELAPAPAAPTTGQLFADDADPPAAPIPVFAEGSTSIPAVSTTDATALDAQARPFESERPRFIAPGTR
jgi:hypothetical protein